MADIEIKSYGVNDVPLNLELYWNAYKQGMSLSQLLETLNPTTDPKEELDAFERQLMRFGIRMKGDPKTGLGASKGEMFFQSNHPASAILFPEVLNRMARQAVMEDKDVLDELIFATETISDSAIYRALYIDDTETQRQFRRVTERGEFPRVKISWSEKATTLAKYGVCIQMTYEFVRRATMPIIQTLIGRIMLQTRIDECYEAIQALLLGDGTGHASGGAISHTHLSAYIGGTPSTFAEMTYPGYLAWLNIFWPGMCTTIIGKDEDVIMFMLIPKPDADPIWLFSLLDKDMLGGRPRLVNNRLSSEVRFVSHPDLDTGMVIGIDRRYAMMAYREVGADLTETNKIINGQWNEIVMSNTIGFQTYFASARKQLFAANGV